MGYRFFDAKITNFILRWGPILLGIYGAVSADRGYAKSENKRLRIEIGEAQILDLPGFANINVNRRGIIDVQFIDDFQWQVTGLKEGLAIMSAPGKSATERVFVEVRRASHSSPVIPSQFDKICQRQGFLCDPGTTIIRGEITDAIEFFWAKKICGHIQDCDFQAKLSLASVKEQEEKLRLLMQSRYQVIMNQHGYSLVLAPCGERDIKVSTLEVEALSAGMAGAKMLTVICRDQYLKTTYRFKSKIIVVDDADSLEYGSGLTSHSNLAFTNDRFQFFTEAEFKALSKSHNIRVAGEPLLRLVEGSETLIESGGEFPVFKIKSDRDNGQEAMWKQYGLALKVKAMSDSDKKITVHIDFSVRTPGGGSYQDNLQLNRLASVVRADLGKPMVVGGVEIETGGGKEQYVPILSMIPIIGPLFKMVTKEQGHSRLFLWILLDADDSVTELGQGMQKFPGLPAKSEPSN